MNSASVNHRLKKLPNFAANRKLWERKKHLKYSEYLPLFVAQPSKHVPALYMVDKKGNPLVEWVKGKTIFGMVYSDKKPKNMGLEIGLK